MTDDVARALRSAKFNESVQITVTVTVTADGSEGMNSQEISLVACLDEENGGVQWNDVGDGDHGDDDDHDNGSGILCRHLRTKRWFFPMLNDHRRTVLYEQAIERASSEVSRRLVASRDGDGDQSPDAKRIQCLDIGSGTGLLAMMSARSLKKRFHDRPVHVTSIEMSGAMATIARETIASNKLETCVSIVEGHSCEIPPLSHKALLCTSELLESGLLGEGWIPAIRDAWERHLDPAAVVVPRAAKVFAQVVEGDGVSKFWGPHQRLDGLNEKNLSLALDAEGKNVLLCGGGNSDSDQGVRVPVHIDKLLHDVNYPIRTLSDPVEVLEVRLDCKDGIPSKDGQTRSTTFIPSASGVAHGVLFWWELDLFGDDLSYNTGPNLGPWQDHWQQCLYVFASPSEDLVRIEKGQPTTLQASHDDTTISFSVLAGETESKNSQPKRPRPTREVAKLVSPQRAWQLNDSDRFNMIRDGVKTLLDQRGLDDAIVLDVSDFSLCAMIAALLGASNVVSLEASPTDLPEATARIAQLSNGLPALPRDGSNKQCNIFQMIRCHPEQLTVDLLGGSAADIVVAEPYYEVLEGWTLQEALNFFYILRGLKKRQVIRPDALTLPCHAKIMGCAFESYDIGDAYRNCSILIGGFSHDVVRKYHTWSDHYTSIPSWQYDITPLSEVFEIGMLDYRACTIKQNYSTEHSVAFTRKGTCHGMLVWIEYGLPTSIDGTINTLSTRGRSYYQMIQLLHGPGAYIQNVNPTDMLCCQATIGKRSEHGDDYHFILSIKPSNTSHREVARD